MSHERICAPGALGCPHVKAWISQWVVVRSSVMCAVVVVAALLTAQGPANEFTPDTTFAGSSLTGWRPLGAADWQAQAGEIVGRPRAGGQGGWLVLDRSYQDLNFFTRFRCAGPCQAGVLFRLRKTDTGMTGVYVSLQDADLKTYRITLDPEGRETARDALRPAAPFVRVAPPPTVAGAMQRPGRGVAGGFSMIGAGRGGGPVTLPTPLPELMPPPPGIRQGEWNLLSVTMDANLIRPILNQSYDFIPGATDERDDYGPIALYAGGTGEVRFKDVSFKDLHVRHNPPEQVSPRFRMQRLDEFYYSWGATAGDFNNDGVLDVVAGPYYYLGPAYTTRVEIDIAPAQSPSTSFARTMVDYAYDFTGDGWTDVLAGESRPMHLYVNPKGENRRWAKHPVLPQITSELAVMRDIDGRRQARDRLRHRRRRRHARVRMARPCEPHGSVADARDLGARARARSWPRRRRCERRRTNRCPSGGGMVGAAGRRSPLRSLDIPSVCLRALGSRRGRRRRRDGRVRRERRPSERRRRGSECAWIRARVVPAEA